MRYFRKKSKISYFNQASPLNMEVPGVLWKLLGNIANAANFPNEFRRKLRKNMPEDTQMTVWYWTTSCGNDNTAIFFTFALQSLLEASNFINLLGCLFSLHTAFNWLSFSTFSTALNIYFHSILSYYKIANNSKLESWGDYWIGYQWKLVLPFCLPSNSKIPMRIHCQLIKQYRVTINCRGIHTIRNIFCVPIKL